MRKLLILISALTLMVLSCGNSGSENKELELHRLHHIQHLTVQGKDLRLLLRKQELKLILMRKMQMEKQLMQI